MPKISPKVLRNLREARRMTLDQLSDESRVSKGTINKIETGRREEIHHSTHQRLARALNVSPEVLEGKASPSDATLTKLSNVDKSEMSVTLDDQCRNALQLVAWRYGTLPSDILNLAPFLYFWAAEKSLQVRSDGLKQIAARFDEIDSVRKASLPHIGFRISHHFVSEEISALEAESIQKRDLFGRAVEEGSDDVVFAIRDDYDESEHNPFTGFLRTLASELQDRAQFDWMYSSGPPRYEVCRDIALKLVGGDEAAAGEVLAGRAPLHLMPKELLGKEKGADRAAWAKAEAKKRPAFNLDDLGI